MPVGVTKPKRAFLELGGPVASFAWKPLRPGYTKGFMEQVSAAEIGAANALGIAAKETGRPLDRSAIDAELLAESEACFEDARRRWSSKAIA